jgi:hypothetical protein
MRGSEAVQAVAGQAVENMNLPRNAVKGGWEGLTLRRLFWFLLAEVRELAGALWRLSRLRSELHQLEREERLAWDRCAYLADRDRLRAEIEKARQAVKHEAGDVVAFAAMIFDRI